MYATSSAPDGNIDAPGTVLPARAIGAESGDPLDGRAPANSDSGGSNDMDDSAGFTPDTDADMGDFDAAYHDAVDDTRTGLLESKLDHRADHRKKRRGLADGFKKNKVVNEVLDKPTVMTLYKMITDGVLSGVNGSVSAGKESLVFWGLDGSGADVALKVYLVSTSNFKRRQAYILGDPRFASFKKNTRSMVYLWAKKEFRNLHQCAEAGIPVPRPIRVANNVLAMEFIGCDGADGMAAQGTECKNGGAAGRPARMLLHSHAEYDDYLQAISIISDMYKKANLVHGDYSEYNLFKVDGRGLVVFDLGSAVDKRHPNSDGFLQRDINNITRFFKKRGVEVDDDTTGVMEAVKS